MKAYLSRYACAAAVLVLAGYAVVTLRGPRGLHGLVEVQAQIRDAEKRNAAIEDRIRQKRQHIDLLENNPAQQELEIRQRLKLIHPNEKVFIIGGDGKPVAGEGKK